jgi:hypothetical protein
MAGSRGAEMLMALSSLAPIFIGGGDQKVKKTTTSNRQVDQTAVKSLQQLLASPATDPSAAAGQVKTAQDDLIQRIMQANVPSIGSAERGMGIYNSSQTAKAMTDLLAGASTQGAKLALDQQNAAAGLRTQASQALGAMTERTTTTSNDKIVNEAAIDPLYSALGLGAGLLYGNRDMFGFGDDKKKSGAEINIAPTGQFSPITLQSPVTSAIDALIGNTATNFASGLKSSTTNSDGSFRSGGVDEFFGAGLNAIATSLVQSVFGGGGSSGGGSDSGGGFSFGTVICTKMYELGYMDKETYEADQLYGEQVAAENPELLAWYHSWAVPFVATLHKGTLKTKAVAWLTKHWSSEMKARLGYIKSGTTIGKLIFAIGMAAFTFSKFVDNHNPLEIR